MIGESLCAFVEHLIHYLNDFSVFFVVDFKGIVRFYLLQNSTNLLIILGHKGTIDFRTDLFVNLNVSIQYNVSLPIDLVSLQHLQEYLALCTNVIQSKFIKRQIRSYLKYKNIPER